MEKSEFKLLTKIETPEDLRKLTVDELPLLCDELRADIVQEVTAYITLGATLRQLRETVHIHPTLSEVLIEVN